MLLTSALTCTINRSYSLRLLCDLMLFYRCLVQKHKRIFLKQVNIARLEFMSVFISSKSLKRKCLRVNALEPGSMSGVEQKITFEKTISVYSEQCLFFSKCSHRLTWSGITRNRYSVIRLFEDRMWPILTSSIRLLLSDPHHQENLDLSQGWQTLT